MKETEIIQAELIRMGFAEQAEWISLFEKNQQTRLKALHTLLYAQPWPEWLQQSIRLEMSLIENKVPCLKV